MDTDRDYKADSKGEHLMRNTCVLIFSLGDAMRLKFYNSQGQ
jgi:hypothetical protein